MELMPNSLLARFEKVGSQEGRKDPVIVAHYFNPTGAGNWYATEYDPESRVFFGYVSIFGDHNDEWGYFSLTELEEYTGLLGLGIELDRYWIEKPATKVIRGFTGWGE